jgi:hypothetical protein
MIREPRRRLEDGPFEARAARAVEYAIALIAIVSAALLSLAR